MTKVYIKIREHEIVKYLHFESIEIRNVRSRHTEYITDECVRSAKSNKQTMLICTKGNVNSVYKSSKWPPLKF